MTLGRRRAVKSAAELAARARGRLAPLAARLWEWLRPVARWCAEWILPPVLAALILAAGVLVIFGLVALLAIALSS